MDLSGEGDLERWLGVSDSMIGWVCIVYEDAIEFTWLVW